MKKILLFAESISEVYTIVYVIVIHIIGIGLIGYHEIDFNQPIVDIILGYIRMTIIFLFCDIVLLIPSLILIAFSAIISALMLISVPIYLFLCLFEVMGSQIVSVLEYGFLQTLLICIIATPIGYMNILSTKKLDQ